MGHTNGFDEAVNKATDEEREYSIYEQEEQNKAPALMCEEIVRTPVNLVKYQK